MTARRDPDRLIQAYLEEGQTELPDRAYDAVRYEIDHTRQRAVFGPWRVPNMSNIGRFAMAAAAVLLVAVVGIYLLPKGGGVGGPAVSPTQAPTAAPSPTAVPTLAPSPSPTAAAVKLPVNGALAAGTYYIDDRAMAQAERFTFTMPAGWTTSDYGFIAKDRDEPGEVMLIPWVVTHVFSDACRWGTLVDAGTTVDELVTALVEQEGREASAPSDVTLGGFPAKRIELIVPADLDVSMCSNGFLRYWPDAGPNLSGGLCCNPPGNTDVVYVIDVAGNRLVVVARHYPGSSAENRAELQAIVDSIVIEP